MTNVVSLQTGGKIAGIIPQSIEDVFRLAKAVALSGLAPRGMDTAEKLTVAILHGMEIGLPPMQSIQRIAVVNGRPTVWGDAIPALLQARGFKLRETITGGPDTRCATCEIERPDGQKIERQFSKTDAIKAGLWGKAGPWTQYPDRMMQMRARGFACRDGAADALSGLYLREEIEEAGQEAKTISAKATALELPDIPDEAQSTDDTADVIEAINGAINLEMLEHVRSEAFPDFDWDKVSKEYDAKYDQLKGAA